MNYAIFGASIHSVKCLTRKIKGQCMPGVAGDGQLFWSIVIFDVV